MHRSSRGEPVLDRLQPCPTDELDEPLECFGRWRERMVAAERSAGWLAECDDAGRFLAVGQELVDALSDTLRQVAEDGPVLEICAGSGELACRLAGLGVSIIATDAEPTEGSEVLRLSAAAALCQYEPTVLLGAFVPFDSGVDEAVLACPSVQHYVVLNARIGGMLGSAAIWQASGWKAEPLEPVRRWMLTRHDVWIGPLDQAADSSVDLLQHGEAWLFTRTASTSSPERTC